MKRNKSGISLIVLVITIIVMIILAGSVIISLSNSGIIEKANEAVDANNLKQVQQLASLAWAEAYMDKLADNTVDLKVRVEEALAKNKVDTSKYAITVTDSGVQVLEATLGNLINGSMDFGKYVDYTVTVAGRTYNEWQVYYEDEENGYVYIVTKDIVEEVYPTGVTVENLTNEEKALYSKFQVGSWPKYTLKDKSSNSQSVAYLIKNYGAYANKALYGKYVIGAIGGPTIELFSAGWNAKGLNPTIILTTAEYGYAANDEEQSLKLDADGLYVIDSAEYMLASPSAYDGYGSASHILAVTDIYSTGLTSLLSSNDYPYGVRPVVCLSSNIPATTTANGYSLVK